MQKHKTKQITAQQHSFNHITVVVAPIFQRTTNIFTLLLLSWCRSLFLLLVQLLGQYVNADVLYLKPQHLPPSSFIHKHTQHHHDVSLHTQTYKHTFFNTCCFCFVVIFLHYFITYLFFFNIILNMPMCVRYTPNKNNGPFPTLREKKIIKYGINK